MENANEVNEAIPSLLANFCHKFHQKRSLAQLDALQGDAEIMEATQRRHSDLNLLL